MTQGTNFFALGGGMDLVTPSIQQQPGRVIASLNYEPTASGYKRLRGFERIDGHPAPSTSDYWVAPFHAGSSALLGLAAGATVYLHIGGTDKVTAFLVAVVQTGGNFSTGDGTGYLVIAPYEGLIAGAFTDVEAALLALSGFIGINDISGSRTPAYATVTVASDWIKGGIVTGQPMASWSADAKAYLRAAISAPPGSGPIRGVWYFNGQILCFRDNAGATAGGMYVAGPRGWLAVNIASSLPFTSGGTTELLPGMGIVGATSHATAVIVAVVLASGTWAAGDAAGTLYVQAQAGTFVAENLNISLPSTLNQATIAGNSATYAIPPGGSYEFVNNNFFGAADFVAMYGVNGVGNGFFYDKYKALTKIVTGMTVDQPTHVAVHANALFYSFAGGSVQFSSPGDPTTWDPVLGTGEIGIGDDVTNLVSANVTTLAILGANSVNVLSGHDQADFVLDTLTREAGALARTAQHLGQLVYMDNRGLRALSATQAFGDFAQSSMSRLVAPLLEDLRKDQVDPTASLVARAKDQYWCFFENGSGIVVYTGKKNPEILPFNLGKTVTTACSVEVTGVERQFIGCDDGFVYELDKGTSFDGVAIEHYVRLPFWHFGSPKQNKRFMKVSIEVEASGSTTLLLSADLNYGADPGIDSQSLVVTTGGGAIDSLGSNEEYFASQIETLAEAYIGCVARNISLKISGSTSAEEPHTLTGVTYHLSPRGLTR